MSHTYIPDGTRCADCGLPAGDRFHGVPTYADHVRSLVDAFDYELCGECGRDLDAHVIAPDPMGNPHAWCARPLGEDAQRLVDSGLPVAIAATMGEHAIGDALAILDGGAL